jgi:hypothetical protein
VQIIVQEGNALVSLITPIQAPDDGLRTSTVQSIAGPVKVYYRDYEVILVEAREGALEIMRSSIGAITWTTKDRRYQLKIAE